MEIEKNEFLSAHIRPFAFANLSAIVWRSVISSFSAVRKQYRADLSEVFGDGEACATRSNALFCYRRVLVAPRIVFSHQPSDGEPSVRLIELSVTYRLL